MLTGLWINTQRRSSFLVTRRARIHTALSLSVLQQQLAQTSVLPPSILPTQSANLGRTEGWFVRARLWRIVLLASEGGCWEPCPGLAVALLAFGSRADARGSGSVEPQAEGLRCPLSGFSEGALHQSVPPALLAVQAATAGMVDAGRIWATVLSLSSLRRMREHYAAEPGPLLGESVTVFDRGVSYLAEMARQHPALATSLPRVLVDADAQTRAWEASQAAGAAAIRGWVAARGPRMAQSGWQRVLNGLLLTVRRSHGAHSIQISPVPALSWRHPQMMHSDRVCPANAVQRRSQCPRTLRRRQRGGGIWRSCQ